jgi:hypothetical protein
MDRSTWTAIGVLGFLFWLAEVEWYIYLLAPFVMILVIMVFSVPVLWEIAYRRHVPFWIVYKTTWLSLLFPWRGKS